MQQDLILIPFISSDSRISASQQLCHKKQYVSYLKWGNCSWKALSCSASQEIPALYRTRHVITVFTKVHNFSLFWEAPIQYTSSHHISLSPILILFSHLRLVLPSALLNWCFSTKIRSFSLLRRPFLMPCPSVPHKSWSSSRYQLQPRLCLRSSSIFSVSSTYLTYLLTVTSYSYPQQPSFSCTVSTVYPTTQAASHSTAVPYYQPGCAYCRPTCLSALCLYRHTLRRYLTVSVSSLYLLPALT